GPTPGRRCGRPDPVRRRGSARPHRPPGTTRPARPARASRPRRARAASGPPHPRGPSPPRAPCTRRGPLCAPAASTPSRGSRRGRWPAPRGPVRAGRRTGRRRRRRPRSRPRRRRGAAGSGPRSSSHRRRRRAGAGGRGAAPRDRAGAVGLPAAGAQVRWSRREGSRPPLGAPFAAPWAPGQAPDLRKNVPACTGYVVGAAYPPGVTARSFRVLGPVEVWFDGRPVPRQTPRHRAVLAALLVDAGNTVPLDVLVDRVWNGQPPTAVLGTLQAVISKLRRELEPDAAGGRWQVLVTRDPGYRLEVGPEDVDALCFTALLRSARGHAERGEVEAARTAVGEALELWRGPAYADVAETFAVEESARLEQLRLDAREL